MEQMRPNRVYLSTPGGNSDADKPAPAAPPPMSRVGPEGRKPAARNDVSPGVPEAGRRPAGPAGRSAGEKESQAGGKEGQQPAAGDDRGVRQQDHHLVGRPGGAGDGPAVVLRLVTQTTAGEGDFDVIHLHNANAVEAAKLLDQAFNGPKPTTAQQPQGGPAASAGSSVSSPRATTCRPPKARSPTRFASSPTPRPTRCW